MLARLVWVVAVFALCAWLSSQSWSGAGGPDLDMAMQVVLGAS